MTETKFRNLGVLSVVLTLVALATKVLGFVRDVLVSAWWGASEETDAFYFVFGVLVVMLLAAAVQLPRTFIPEYQKRALADESSPGSTRAASYFGINLMLVPVAAALAVALFFWTEELFYLIAPELPERTREISVQLAHALLPAIPCIALAAVVTSLAQARGHLVLVQSSMILLNLCGIIGLLALGPSMGIEGLALGLCVGCALQCLVVASYPVRERLRPRLSKEATAVMAGSFGILGGLLLVNYSGGMLLNVSERYFSTGLPAGHLSCMGYAQRLGSLPNQVLFGGLLVLLLPALSDRVTRGDSAEIERLTLRALRMLMLLQVPALAGIALFARPLVEVVYERGAFDSEAASLTALLLVLFVPTLLTEVIRLVLATLFFAYARPMVPIVYGCLRVLSLTVAWALSWEAYGAVGMVVSMAVVDLVGAILFMDQGRRRLGFDFSTLVPFVLRLGLATVAALVLGWSAFHGAELLVGSEGLPQQLALLGAAAAAGGLGFLLASKALGLSEAQELLALLARLAGKNSAQG
jgi:putative peptidoglycan lipid II flippase